MEDLVKNHGVEEFMMVDDIFNFDLDRAKEICRGIKQRGLKIHLQFPNGVRGDRFDEELVALMKQAGTHFMPKREDRAFTGFVYVVEVGVADGLPPHCSADHADRNVTDPADQPITHSAAACVRVRTPRVVWPFRDG